VSNRSCVCRHAWHGERPSLYLCNAGNDPLTFVLPRALRGVQWHVVFDTAHWNARDSTLPQVPHENYVLCGAFVALLAMDSRRRVCTSRATRRTKRMSQQALLDELARLRVSAQPTTIMRRNCATHIGVAARNLAGDGTAVDDAVELQSRARA